jgi:nucleoside-diphosphate-sugar epimerase
VHLIAGAGGFIGGALVARLLKEGKEVRAVDIKPFDNWYQLHKDAQNLVLDLKSEQNCKIATQKASSVWNLAADMGGMGFIENHKADCMLSVLINTNLLLAARQNKVERFFFSSSACVYPGYKQGEADVLPLKEDDVYPADPEDGYGWEKLFSERMCRHFTEDFGLQTRIARYHNVYGPFGTYAGGREKAPAAVCRKVIEAKMSGNHEIVVWGDGNQTRSFMYIDDCIRGSLTLMESDYLDPINIGSAETVTINQLIDIVEQIAGIRVVRRYNLNAPQGVRGRSSDNTLFRSQFDWEPDTPLVIGMEKTYRWIYNQMAGNISN